MHFSRNLHPTLDAIHEIVIFSHMNAKTAHKSLARRRVLMVDTTESDRVSSHAADAFDATEHESDTDIDTDIDTDTDLDTDTGLDTDTDIDINLKTKLDAVTETKLDADLDDNAAVAAGNHHRWLTTVDTIASTACENDTAIDATIAAFVFDDVAHQAEHERASQAQLRITDRTEVARSW